MAYLAFINSKLVTLPLSVGWMSTIEGYESVTQLGIQLLLFVTYVLLTIVFMTLSHVPAF